MTKREKFMCLCDEVTQFCLRHTAHCFKCWPKETIFLYVGFHAMTGGLFLRRKNGAIIALGFAWPASYNSVKALHDAGKSPFQWNLPKCADVLLVAEVVADKESCALFLEKAKRQWPDLKRAFTFREQNSELRLVEIHLDRLVRYYGQWKLNRGNA